MLIQQHSTKKAGDRFVELNFISLFNKVSDSSSGSSNIIHTHTRKLNLSRKMERENFLSRERARFFASKKFATKFKRAKTSEKGKEKEKERDKHLSFHFSELELEHMLLLLLLFFQKTKRKCLSALLLPMCTVCFSDPGNSSSKK